MCIRFQQRFVAASGSDRRTATNRRRQGGIRIMERTNGKRIAIVTGSASDWAMNSRDSSSTADGSSPASTSTPNARPNWPANSPGALTAGSSAMCPTRLRQSLGGRDRQDRAHRPADQQCRAALVQDADRLRGRRRGQMPQRPQGHDSVVRPDAQGMRRTEPQNRQRDEHRRYARQRQRIRVLRHQMG